ncbi:MAG: hypothetical protein Q9219_001555 [cf. Caloplaca sp. 3 TL-2023]
MRAVNVLAALTLFRALTFAIPWIEPSPTAQGLLDAVRVSPRPTGAPGAKDIPLELRRRQQDLLYPPPDNWCGFIEGDYDNPLTCRSPLQCVNYGTAVGCCSNTLPGCTNVYTDCYAYGSSCDADCERDDKIRKCSDSDFPYCGTYSFPTGTYLYNCESTTNYGASSVEQLADFYVTAVSSTYERLTSSGSSAFSASAPTRSPLITSSPSTSSSSDDGGGLSADAIRGIAIGVSVGACAIFILLAFIIVRKRRANRMKRAAQPNLPPAYTPGPSMQQHNNQVYQPVPQQDQPYPPNQGGYFAPPAPGKDGAAVTSHASLSPGQDPSQQQRFSTANNSLLSPNTSVAGRESVYKMTGPTSPTITEVDGSDRPLPEADSIQRPQSTHQGLVSPLQTASNPGSPAPPAGHFMQQYGNPVQGQQQPGQGQMHNGYVAPHAGSHEMPPTQPYMGPYEMPHERH